MGNCKKIALTAYNATIITRVTDNHLSQKDGFINDKKNRKT